MRQPVDDGPARQLGHLLTADQQPLERLVVEFGHELEQHPPALSGGGHTQALREIV